MCLQEGDEFCVEKYDDFFNGDVQPVDPIKPEPKPEPIPEGPSSIGPYVILVLILLLTIGAFIIYRKH